MSCFPVLNWMIQAKKKKNGKRRKRMKSHHEREISPVIEKRLHDQTTLSGSRPVAVTGSAKGHIQKKYQIHSPRKETSSIKMDWFAEKNWKSIDWKGRNMVISTTRAIAYPWRMSLSLYGFRELNPRPRYSNERWKESLKKFERSIQYKSTL